MADNDSPAELFEEKRGHWRAVAYRMLGSLAEADDAVQEAWLRLSRSGGSSVDNLGAWLTTVVARVCLDMLRSRRSRREDPLEVEQAGRMPSSSDPEQELLLANSVGLALLVILDTLEPAERLAFVLHDMFAMPFDEIAEVVGCSTDATRQLASRARRRIQGSPAPQADRSRQREIVDAYLAAAREGNFDALLSLLDPNVVLRGSPRAGTRRAGGNPRRRGHRHTCRQRGCPRGSARAHRRRSRRRRGSAREAADGSEIQSGGRKDHRDGSDRRSRSSSSARSGCARLSARIRRSRHQTAERALADSPAARFF
jgi:RNA polymerase sigma-70 factor, ECF subfamily